MHRRFANAAGSSPPVDGLLDTGDIGYWADGELVIFGRRKAMVKVNGVALYAEDIEGCCETLPQVASGGSVALDLGQLGELTGLALIVEERSPSPDLARVVRARVREGFWHRPPGRAHRGSRRDPAHNVGEADGLGMW